MVSLVNMFTPAAGTQVSFGGHRLVLVSLVILLFINYNFSIVFEYFINSLILEIIETTIVFQLLSMKATISLPYFTTK